MKSPAFLLFFILAVVAAATGQVVLASENYFPAELEFQELLKTTSEEVLEDPSQVSKINGGRLFLDVGFDKYARRAYSTGTGNSLTIEVVTLKNFRAAYSLLTLLRSSDIQEGPPGDAFTETADSICFAQGREWVRILGHGCPEDLLKGVANSVSNRIGGERHKAPSLISHLPELGIDASSLRYFPGLNSYESYSGKIAGGYLKPEADAEIAQAHYSLDNRTGNLVLLSFPTTEVAEGYFAGLAGPKPAEESSENIYSKRAGPIVAILEGTFDPASADKILGFIRFSYSIRWIYEKQKESKTIWGVPTRILGTVVNSLLFVVLLCGISVVAGAGFAIIRFVLHGRAPTDSPERDEITRLRLQ